MKRIFAFAILLACAGCAHRDVTLYYYPNMRSTAHFAEYAQRECAKYGMVAIHNFTSQRGVDGESYMAFRCEDRR
jgi:hypothetical protein